MIIDVYRLDRNQLEQIKSVLYVHTIENIGLLDNPCYIVQDDSAWIHGVCQRKDLNKLLKGIKPIGSQEV